MIASQNIDCDALALYKHLLWLNPNFSSVSFLFSSSIHTVIHLLLLNTFFFSILLKCLHP